MTQQKAGELSKRVIDRIITSGWGRPRDGHAISPDSQIYYDLGIYGDDFFELVRWMHEDFGVQTMSGFESYAPSEGAWPFRFFTRFIRGRLETPSA
jgi:hypothetical protein